jgi:hypothetical protein
VRDNLTPWAEEDIDWVRRRAAEYEATQWWLGMQRSLASEAEKHGACSGCGYLKCSCPRAPVVEDIDGQPVKVVRQFSAEPTRAFWKAIVEWPAGSGEFHCCSVWDRDWADLGIDGYSGVARYLRDELLEWMEWMERFEGGEG